MICSAALTCSGNTALTWQPLLGTLDPPAYDAYKSPLSVVSFQHKWPPRVTLTSVLSPFSCASTEEDFGNGLGELGLAFRIVPHRKRYLPQDGAGWAAEGERSPSNDRGQFSDEGQVAALGEADGPNVFGKTDAAAQSQEGDVVLIRVLLELVVLTNSGDVKIPCQTARCVFEVVLAESHRDVLRT